MTLAAAKPTMRVGTVALLRDYISLTKPRIIETLLITTVPPMFVAQGGLPSLTLILATVIGGMLSAGGANAANMWFDRDIDAQMHRTRNRPLVRGTITPHAALRFAIILECVAFIWLFVLVNPLSAYLALSAALFYVFIYTMWLKRSTTSNIVIGGAAGAVPALIGWAAVDNNVTIASLMMFAIVFLWTPPHFWALAMKYRQDYETARVPMLPVVKPARETIINILLYTVALIASTLALAPIARLGVLYMTCALLAGAVFLGYTLRLALSHDNKDAMKVFHWSITHITIVFCAMAIDQFIG